MFKTIKSRVIFVIVFCLICIAITTGAIIYKNIEIDETFTRRYSKGSQFKGNI